MINKIAAIVLTYNEEKHIGPCLQTLQWVDELIVIDDFSQDDTVNIARTLGARIYERKLDSFSSQRNFALEKCNADWILVLDADERITEELKLEILDVLSNPLACGYKMPRKNYFMGKRIRGCGWYPDYSLRLFRKTGAVYTKTVHEHLDIAGPVRKLKNPLLHYTYTSMEQYLQKLDKYTTMDAEELYNKGKRANLCHIVLRPAYKFLNFYIFRMGFLDGLEGFILSALSAFYVLVKYTKLYFKPIKETL